MSDIFTDFDMLVAVNQKTVNAQLAKLAAQGSIPGKITLLRTMVNNVSTYAILAGPELVPRHPDGSPAAEYLDVQLQPRIQIDKNGTDIVLMLGFVSGTACLFSGVGPLAQLLRHDVAGWQYGIDVSLNLTAVAADSPHLPPILKQELDTFNANLFSVSALFANLAAVTEEQFQSALVRTADTATHDALIFFMSFYLKSLGAAGTPYILGYTAHATPQSKADAITVPDTLLPTATTFTLVRNDNPDQSCVVYALATRGCHATVSGTPVNLPEGWGGDIATARLLYAPSALIEPLILKPFFEQLQANTFAGIKDSICVGPGNAWQDAMTEPSAGSWKIAVAYQEGDDDRYHNSFQATAQGQPRTDIIPLIQGGTQFSFPNQRFPFNAPPEGPGLFLQGTIWVFKQHTTDLFFGKAQAWATKQIDWAGCLAMRVDADGALSIQGGLTTEKTTNDSGHNAGASFLDGLQDIMNGIGTALTLGMGGGVLGNLFSGLTGQGMSPTMMSSLATVFGNLPGSATRTVMLPAGDVFKFSGIDCSPAGVVSIEMDYR